MRAHVYAVPSNGYWTWRISLSRNVDLKFWLKSGKRKALIFLEPSLPAGVAAACRELLAQTDHIPDNTGHVLPRMEQAVQKGAAPFFPTHLKQFRLRVYASPVQDLPEISLEKGLFDRLTAYLAGRRLLLEECVALLEYHEMPLNMESLADYLQLAYLRGGMDYFGGIDARLKRSWLKFGPRTLVMRCHRCGSGPEFLEPSDCSVCGEGCVYCRECLAMGRIRRCSFLIAGKGDKPLREIWTMASIRHDRQGDSEQKVFPGLERWNLSPPQEAAAREGIRFLGQPLRPEEGMSGRMFLIWAVTGAGKTEMIFPFIDFVLQREGQVLVATPRRDVVLELMPRLRSAFPHRKIVALYGGSEERWERGEITLATTHQLLRFREAFDLVIIDELDAFPFHNNPALEQAARNACRRDGKFVLLTATPPLDLKKMAEKGRIAHAKVPVRYHGHPLPEPVLRRCLPISKWIGGREVPPQLVHQLQRSLDREAQIFVFIPKMREVEAVTRRLQMELSNAKVEGTSSQDPRRGEKVKAFREGNIRVLVTTTILERGVTVPKTDVFVLDADSPLFDEAALVQMAGRAGRSAVDPAGNVFFFAEEKTRHQVEAVRHIRMMNSLARRLGYLLPEAGGKRGRDVVLPG